MTKTSIIIVVISIFLAFELSGCMKQSYDNVNKRFLGMWNEIDPNIPHNMSYFHKVTFYNNGTLNDTFWYEGFGVEEPVTKWYNYKIDGDTDGDTLCLTQLDVKEGNSTCYHFNFSSDEKTLNLTSIDQPQFVVILKKAVN